MKIPFDIKYRPQIESGEYKVKTRTGESVRIICWDKQGECPIVVVSCVDGDEGVYTYHENGHYVNGEGIYDLFIVTPEEEMTEFELFLFNAVLDNSFVGAKGNENALEMTKKIAPELLALAKKELCNGCNASLEGYIKGQQDAKRQYDESVAYHFPIVPQRPLCYEPGGTCTNPHHDCINCPAQYSSGGTISTPNTQSGTSTSTLHGNTSVTDGKEHNSSFID